MTDDLQRPGFWPSFFGALAERSAHGSFAGGIIFYAVAIAIGAAIAYALPGAFWADADRGPSSTALAGVLTFNGILLALGWSAFSRIYDIISSPRFSMFLKKHNLLNKYLITLSLIQSFQIFAVVMSAIALIAVFFENSFEIINRIIFGAMITCSIIALRQASSAVRVMNDLIWQKCVFDENDRSAGNRNVIDLPLNQS